MKHRQTPISATKPAVTNGPPILWVVKPLRICLIARSRIPDIDVVLEPRSRRILVPARARITAHVTATEPTKDSVADSARR
jgi:hypothetical protein